MSPLLDSSLSPPSKATSCQSIFCFPTNTLCPLH
jgi:hypothetical protein